MLKKKINLIPRYNWDYTISDWATAIYAIFGRGSGETNEIESFFGQKPLMTGTGRTSLYTILKSLKLPKGSGIAVPLFCCHVVFEAIRQAELVPIFIDINYDDYNLSVKDLEDKNKLFSAVVVVHMFGHPADMDAILSVTNKKPVIEDCAQSLCSTYKGRPTGFISEVSFFSFRSGKYISAGEGSAIFCKDDELFGKINRQIQSYAEWTTGQQGLHCTTTLIKSILYKRPLFGAFGYPVGMVLDEKMNLTAKNGFNLNKIPKCNLKMINERLKSISLKIDKQRNNALKLLKSIRIKNAYMNYQKKECHSNYYQFPIRFADTTQRDRMSAHLLNNGIDTGKYLDTIIETAKKDYGYQGDCPIAEMCSKTTLIIPHYYSLSDNDLEHVIKSVNKYN